MSTGCSGILGGRLSRISRSSFQILGQATMQSIPESASPVLSDKRRSGANHAGQPPAADTACKSASVRKEAADQKTHERNRNDTKTNQQYLLDSRAELRPLVQSGDKIRYGDVYHARRSQTE